MNFYQKVGELIFGTRLKRLSEKFFMDVTRVYKILNIPFETSWFPIFYLLNDKGEMSVTEIASDLDITHSAVSQMLVNLEKKQLIKLLEDESDKRKKIATFTDKGLELMDSLGPVWEAVESAMRDLYSDKNISQYMPTVLNELEQAIEEKSIYERVIKEMDKHKNNTIDIIPYDNAYKPQYKKLIFNWLIDHADVDIIDSNLINDPTKKIKNKTAHILLAKFNQEIIGILVAKIEGDDDNNIIYLIVHKKWRDRQVAKKLLDSLIKHFSANKLETITMNVNPDSTHIIKLLKKTGFVNRNKDSNTKSNNKLNRNIKMRLIING